MFRRKNSLRYMPSINPFSHDVTLTSLENFVLNQYLYDSNMTFNKIAMSEGISRQAVHQAFYRAVAKKLYQKLDQNENGEEVQELKRILGIYSPEESAAWFSKAQAHVARNRKKVSTRSSNVQG